MPVSKSVIWSPLISASDVNKKLSMPAPPVNPVPPPRGTIGTSGASHPRATGATAPAVPGRSPGRFAIALKSSVRRAGRWRVPERYTAVVYKGGGWLDLRAAELSGPVTTFVAVAYKSRVTILVPPSVRVEMTGFGVTQGQADEEDLCYRLPADAPVIHVRGVAYKGTVEIATRPPERPALRR